jgi:predicted ATPase
LTPEQIATRLDDRFRLLTGGSRTALPRQQTLRALIDWSYDMLAEAEKTLLRRLSVFSGGWTLEAAEAVCSSKSVERSALSVQNSTSASTLNAQGSTLVVEEWQVLDLLTALVEKSLVVFEDQEGRYRLLETIRQYARDRLLETGEAEAAREGHRDWFLALAEQARHELKGARQREWLDRLEQEHDNLRAALEWSTDREETEAAWRLADSMGLFWFARGYWSEGRERVGRLRLLPESVVAPPGGLPPAAIQNRRLAAAQARALAWTKLLATLEGDPAAAWALAAESVRLARALGDKSVLAEALFHQGERLLFRGDLAAARAVLRAQFSRQPALFPGGLRRGALGSPGKPGGHARDRAPFRHRRHAHESRLGRGMPGTV